jgi:hypothetical protein
VYSWGSGLYGQLGHGDTNDQPTPKLVESLNETLQYRVFKDTPNNLQTNENRNINSDKRESFVESSNTTEKEEPYYEETMLENTLKSWDSGADIQTTNKIPYRPSIIFERVRLKYFLFTFLVVLIGLYF